MRALSVLRSRVAAQLLALVALLWLVQLVHGWLLDVAGDGPVAHLLLGDGQYAAALSLGGIIKGIGSGIGAVGKAVVGGVKEAGQFVGRQIKRAPAIAAGIAAGGPVGGALAVITGEVAGGQEPNQRRVAEIATPGITMPATERGSLTNTLLAWVDNIRNQAADTLRGVAGDVETEQQRLAREQAAPRSSLPVILAVGGGLFAILTLGLFATVLRRRVS